MSHGKPKDVSPSEARAVVSRGTDKETREVLLLALSTGARIKRTRSGFLVYGPRGVVAAHQTNSDYRSVKNLRSQLRRIGAYPESGSES